MGTAVPTGRDVPRGLLAGLELRGPPGAPSTSGAGDATGGARALCEQTSSPVFSLLPLRWVESRGHVSNLMEQNLALICSHKCLRSPNY